MRGNNNVEELLEKGATAIVLSRGMLKVLQVCPETFQMLEEKNIPFHVLQTELAVALYNDLYEIEKIML